MAYTLYNLPDYLVDGQISGIYFFEDNQDIRLVIWTTRVDHPAGIGTEYSNRLKSYSLRTGKQLGRLDLNRRYYLDDYRIFGPFGNNQAWGYCVQNGAKLLNLFKPALLADEQTILELNPDLGSLIRIVPGGYKYEYNAQNHNIYVTATNGDIFRITPDLKAYSLRKNEEGANAKSNFGSATIKDVSFRYLNADDEDYYGIDLAPYLTPKIRPYALLDLGDEAYIFLSKDRYTFFALRVNTSTSVVLERIDYFQ
ncbi:MAG: hypothetical protein ABH859_00095 [Pseudomonadota bacterium]